MEQTLAIIKPNAVSAGNMGNILSIYEKSGLRIVKMRMEKLTKDMAAGFYQEHSEKPFYESLISFMTSYEVVLLVLEGDNAVLRNRELMGATDPAKAMEGTIRKLYGKNLEQNGVHGSDSLNSAKREIGYFFSL